MGAYLNKPVTDKTSKDCESNGLIFGASEMQGWRISMEDAWNGIPDFDESSSMFAVYDGHGGQEVAQYCAKRLPDFIKRAESYKNGDLKKALDEAFRDIDKSILTDDVIEELKELAGDEADVDDLNEAAMLSEEATIPIEELLKKMKQEANAIEFEKLIMNGAGGEDEEDEKSSETESHEDAADNHANGDSNEKQSDAENKEHDNDKEDEQTKENEKDDGEKNNDIDTEKTDNKEEEVKDGDEDEKKVEEEEADEEDDSDESDDESEDSAQEDEMEDADEDNMPQSDEVGKDSGATAIVAVLHNDQLVVANVGDSRCVLCRGKKAVDMSKDHKPEDETEKERISKAGGRITHDGRVNGGLNLSRAIGDHNYKSNDSLSPHEQAISSVPDIEETTITKEDKFVILACDGIWNVMTSQEAVDFVSKKLDEQEKEGKICLSKICEQIFDHCVAPDTSGDGSGCDNMTCIIIMFGKNFIGQAGRRKRTIDEGDSPCENPEKKQKCDS